MNASRAAALNLQSHEENRAGHPGLMRHRWARAALVAALPITLLGLLVHTARWRPRALNAGYKPITALAFSPDGRTLAVAGWGGPRGEEVQLWDVSSARLRQTLRAPRSSFAAVLAFSRDGKMLASGGTSLCLWDVRSGRLRREVVNANSRAPLTAVGFSLDGGSLACGRLDGPVEVWDIKSAALKRQLATGAASPCRLAFTGREEVLADLCGVSAQGFEIRRWSLKTGAAPGRAIGDPRGASLPGSAIWAVAPGWKTLAVARGDEVRLWKVEASRRARRHVLRLRRCRVTALAVSARNATLAVAGHDGTLRLWDVRAGQVRQMIQEPRGMITALAFSPDDGILAIGHRNGGVTLRWLK